MVEMKLKGIHKKYDNADFYSITDIAGKLDIREFKAAGKAPFIVISQLGGVCIGMEELKFRDRQ